MSDYNYGGQATFLRLLENLKELLSRYLRTEQLSEAADDVLTQAKESGVFDGKDGITPHIGENENWYIGDTDTGVKAEGKQGPEGKSGVHVGSDAPPEGTNVWVNPQGDNVLTLFDETGNPIPIPAIQGVGIKEIRLEEEHVTHDIYAIVLEDDRIYRFVVRHGENNVSIRNFAPSEHAEGYVGDLWFELPSGCMYICTRGMSRDPYIPSESPYEWKQLEAVRLVGGAPTTETFGNDGDVWVDTLDKVIYVCLGGGMYADGAYYEWVRLTPEKLPNPYALEISGGTLSEPVYYDGTAPVKIQLPTESPKEESGGAPSAPDLEDTVGVYMRVYNGYIQYSEDEETWYDIIAVSELKGDPGQDGTSVTITNVSESTVDGGSNVVTFSDGKKLTVRNGGQGSPGEPGADGNDGITPHIGANGNWFVGETDTGVKAQGEAGQPGTDYVLTSADKTAIATEAAGMVDISGKLDKSGGTMTGALVAQTNTNYTTRQMRNVIYLEDGASVPTTQNGDLVLFYK